MTTYSDKLRDPRWQKKRLEILQRDEFCCQECTDDSSTLHVHHTRYVKGRDPWDYGNGFLVTLCESCHAQLHRDESSVIEHIAGSFYTLGAPWSVLWELAYVLDFAVSPADKLSYKEWATVFKAFEASLKDVVEKRKNV